MCDSTRSTRERKAIEAIDLVDHPRFTPFSESITGTFGARCVNPEQITMRINTDGDYDWRFDLYDRTADRLGENTRTRTIDESCAFTLAMLDNLEEAIDHPDMTEELAEILSTDTARLTYEVTTDIAIGNADSE